VHIAPGNKGQFDVIVDGDIVASKHGVGVVGRLKGDKGFPDDDESVEAVRDRLGAGAS
jgi:hypothetical protein